MRNTKVQYDLDYVKIYASNHTIKEIKKFFNFPSYEATKKYLLQHKISHITESRMGESNFNCRQSKRGLWLVRRLKRGLWLIRRLKK